MATLPPTSESQLSENDQVTHDDSETNPPSPAKPQRSFRHKREQEEPPEGCDHMKKEVKTEEKQEERRCAEERNRDNAEEIKEEEERGFGHLYLIGDNGDSETDEDKQDKMDMVPEEEEVTGEDRSEENDTERKISRDSEESSTETEDETGSSNQGVTNGAPSASAPRPARRVIRLYQYDEDGQRYSHLPDPALEPPLPAPRLKPRTVSLTRLSAIMAAASAGPLDEREEQEGD